MESGMDGYPRRSAGNYCIAGGSDDKFCVHGIEFYAFRDMDS